MQLTADWTKKPFSDYAILKLSSPGIYPMWNQSISAHNCHRNCARLVGSNVNKMPIRYGFRGSPIFDLVWCEHGLEHLFKKLLKFLRWPTTVTANKIYHGKFKFTTANSNSPWKIKIYHGKSTRWSRGKMGVLNNARVGEDRRATARVSEGRLSSSSFFCELWNNYLKSASSGDEFKYFSKCQPS